MEKKALSPLATVIPLRSDIAVQTGPSDRDRARRTHAALDALLVDAESLGGQELALILQCAQECLVRRWGGLDP